MLDERKIRILQAIIDDYINTAEPVSSRAIAKKYNMGVSSATIRNEMADLEEMGFIIQPYTSAGRIPSDRGYRLYVDSLMQHRKLSRDQIEAITNLLIDKINNIDILAKEAATLISLLTNYTTLVSTPQLNKTKFKHIELIGLGGTDILLVTVVDNNIVKNDILKTNTFISQEVLANISSILNSNLQGIYLDEINQDLIESIRVKIGIYQNILNPIFDIISEIKASLSKKEFYTGGILNILDFPEFDVTKAKNIMQLLEQKSIIEDISVKDKQIPTNIQIKIGYENELNEIKNCSIVTAEYQVTSDISGSISIIGPTRMDYSKVVSILSYIIQNMREQK